MKYDNENKVDTTTDTSIEDLFKAIEMAETVALKRDELHKEYKKSRKNIFIRSVIYLLIAQLCYYVSLQEFEVNLNKEVLVTTLLILTIIFIVDFIRTYTELKVIKRDIRMEGEILNNLHTLIGDYQTHLGNKVTFIKKALVEMKLSRIAFHTDYK